MLKYKELALLFISPYLRHMLRNYSLVHHSLLTLSLLKSRVHWAVSSIFFNSFGEFLSKLLNLAGLVN
jgi:hypothetical protein